MNEERPKRLTFKEARRLLNERFPCIPNRGDTIRLDFTHYSPELYGKTEPRYVIGKVKAVIWRDTAHSCGTQPVAPLVKYEVIEDNYADAEFVTKHDTSSADLGYMTAILERSTVPMSVYAKKRVAKGDKYSWIFQSKKKGMWCGSFTEVIRYLMQFHDLDFELDYPKADALYKKHSCPGLVDRLSYMGICFFRKKAFRKWVLANYHKFTLSPEKRFEENVKEDMEREKDYWNDVEDDLRSDMSVLFGSTALEESLPKEKEELVDGSEREGQEDHG